MANGIDWCATFHGRRPPNDLVFNIASHSAYISRAPTRAPIQMSISMAVNYTSEAFMRRLKFFTFFPEFLIFFHGQARIIFNQADRVAVDLHAHFSSLLLERKRKMISNHSSELRRQDVKSWREKVCRALIVSNLRQYPKNWLMDGWLAVGRYARETAAK